MSSVKRENPKRRYRMLLHHDPIKFMDALRDNIIQGPPRRSHALLQLDLLQAHDMTHLVDKYRANDDESLLQLAAIFHGDVEVMSRLAHSCPRLLLLQRQGQYEGQTVLHTLVSKQNVAAAAALLSHPCLQQPWVLLNGKAVGPRFYATVMMGELPLSVAALTFNVEMVDLLLERGAKMHAANTRGDTVFHSLVRFAAHYPEKECEVERMLRELHKRLQTPGATPSAQAEPKSVWLMENREGLTALRLAAALAQPSLFKMVLELEGVYCQLDRHDGLFDSLLYDVTEIDPVARRRWHNDYAFFGGGAGGRKHPRGVAPIRAEGMPSPTHLSELEVGCCPGADTPSPSAIKTNYCYSGGRGGDGGGGGGRRGGGWEGGGRSASVLEIVCETGRVEKAFEVLNTYVLRSIVKAKWRHYRLWFAAWAVLHVLLMVLLTAYAIYKARVVGAARLARQENEAAAAAALAAATAAAALSNATGDGEGAGTAGIGAGAAQSFSVPPSSKSAEENFVKVAAILTMPLSVVVVIWEGMRLWRRQPFNMWLTHHNGLYRVELLVVALSLAADAIWYWVAGPDNNFFLILALLVGWWFTTFFLRPLQKFSFFTVMLQKVLLGDMLRFSTIIVLELLAFSVAMYMTFLSTPGPLPAEFSHLGTALLTMFKLMLGLGEVEVLYDAAHPWLAIALFVLFVLLTYILLLNALIAMMSNTCSLVSENKVSQWELQRLSVVLMLESMLPCECLAYNSGRPMHVARYDLKRKQMIQEIRYFTKVTSVQTSYTDGTAILKRKSMIQTQRFEDIHAVMATMGNRAHIDLLASYTHQQALLGSSDMFANDGEGEDDVPNAYDNGNYDAGYPYPHKAPAEKLFPPHLVVGPAVKGSKAYAGSGHRHEPLTAIREQAESERRGGGGVGGGGGSGSGSGRGEQEVTKGHQGQGQGQGGSDYTSVRQNLLHAMMAAQFAGHLSSAAAARGQGQGRGEGDDSNDRDLQGALSPQTGSSPQRSRHPQPVPPSFTVTSSSPSHPQQETGAGWGGEQKKEKRVEQEQGYYYDDEEEEEEEEAGDRDGYSSDEGRTRRQQKSSAARSPHTPKSVKLFETLSPHHQQQQQQQQLLQVPTSALTPTSSPRLKPKRKRHNSEKIQRPSAHASSGVAPAQLSRSLEMIRSSERRQPTRVQPKLPSPDVYTITPGGLGPASEA